MDQNDSDSIRVWASLHSRNDRTGFADLKHKHGLCWITLRRKKKLSMQVMLVFAAMNLKNWRIGRGKALIAGLFIGKTK
ncbi:transposase [Bacillus haynesii]|uniref:transposase n=1 Tax=Bacillus haynesii TaxID=1925021 RepID=UPI001150E010